MKHLKVINFYAGPGSGKSTSAAGLFYLMKTSGYNVELVTEYAKDKVYEGHLGCLEDQIYIFAKQQRRLNRLVGQVDYAITDSPLPLSILYNKDLNLTFEHLVLDTFHKYSNLNFFINRTKEYKQIGRTQNELEARELDGKLLTLLDERGITIHKFIDGDINAPQNILDAIEKGIEL